MKFRVLIEQDEDGVFIAEVCTLPGCIAQGNTRTEALQNVREAIEVYIESLDAHGDPVLSHPQFLNIDLFRQHSTVRIKIAGFGPLCDPEDNRKTR